MAKIVRYYTVGELVQKTGVPANTLRRWSSRDIIWSPDKISYGRKGFRGHWPEEVVPQAKIVRQCIREGNSLIDARQLIREQFGKQGTFWPMSIKKGYIISIPGPDIDTILNMANLLPDDLKKDYKVEIQEVAKRKIPGYALDFENELRREIRKAQKKPKQSNRE